MNLNSLTAIFAAGSTLPALLAASLPTCSASVQPALELGNRTILMRNGNIALELDDSQRKGMTVEDLLSVFRNQGLDNDRILFSAE